MTLNVSSSLYAGGNLTLNGPTSGTYVTDTFGLIYASGTGSTSLTTLTFSGNVIVKARAVTTYGRLHHQRRHHSPSRTGSARCTCTRGAAPPTRR